MNYYICSLIKDSHTYLDEWITHHLSLGFNNIFLVEDINSSSHIQITSKYPQVHLYKFEDIFHIYLMSGIERQKQLYRYFISTHKEGWCAFIDDDEFISLHNNSTLDSITSIFNDQSGIIIPWQFYDSNNHIKRTPTLINSFNKSKPFYINSTKIWIFKSFINLSKPQEFFNVHWFYNSILQNNQQFNPTENIETTFNLINMNNYMTLDHFFFKSWQDWLWKVTKRGNPTQGLRKLDEFFLGNPNMIPAKELLLSNTNYDSIDFDSLQNQYNDLQFLDIH